MEMVLGSVWKIGVVLPKVGYKVFVFCWVLIRIGPKK
jgi:hypothetical protein